MAEIDVVVAGRTYRLGCEDGQERHLASLAADIDAEARSIAAQAGTLQEGQLLLMAALIVADRLADTTEALRVSQSAATQTPGPEGSAAVEQAMVRLETALDAAEQST